jgi:hypothetical protein
MRRAMLLVACAGAGCGRIGFDATNDGVTDGASGQAEVCNGIDDNLDGLIDENCPCTPFSVALGQSATAPPIDSALLVSTGTGFIVYDLALGFVYVDAAGNVGAPYPITLAASGERIVWDGSALMHAWFPFNNAVEVDRVTPDGVATRVTEIASIASVGTSLERRRDGNFDVALVSGPTNQTVYELSFEPTGKELGNLEPFGGALTNAHAEVAFAAVPAVLRADITEGQNFCAVGQNPNGAVWTSSTIAQAVVAGSPNGFMIAFIDANVTYTITINPTGTVAGSPRNVTGLTLIALPLIAFNGTGFVVSGEVAGPSAIKHASQLLDQTGAPVGAATDVFTSAPYISSGQDIPGALVADASRTVYAVMYKLDNGLYQQQLIQTCP